MTGQQLFKYENGTNQVSISRLLKVIEVLSLSLDYFLEDIKPVEWDEKTSKDRSLCLNVSNNFAKIKDRECQKILSELINILAKKYK